VKEISAPTVRRSTPTTAYSLQTLKVVRPSPSTNAVGNSPVKTKTSKAVTTAPTPMAAGASRRDRIMNQGDGPCFNKTGYQPQLSRKIRIIPGKDSHTLIGESMNQVYHPRPGQANRQEGEEGVPGERVKIQRHRNKHQTHRHGSQLHQTMKQEEVLLRKQIEERHQCQTGRHRNSQAHGGILPLPRDISQQSVITRASPA